MSKNKELAKNTIILFIGTFFTKIIQYFLLPFYTIYLSTTEYGKVELINTFVSLIIPITNLQIDQAIFRFLIDNRKEENNKKEYISTSIFFVVASTIFYTLIFVIVNKFINFEYKNLVVINIIITSFTSLLSQISRGIGKNIDYSISNFLISLVSISLNILLLAVFKMNIDGVLTGNILGYLVAMIYLIIKNKICKYFSIKSISKKKLKELLKYSLPMVPNQLSWWIFSSSDRIVVSKFIDLSATGILSVAYKFSNISLVIYNVFNMSLTETITLHKKDSDISDYYNKIFNSIGNVFININSILIVMMPLVFKLLINESYNYSFNLVPLAIIASVFQVFVGMLSVIYISNNNTKLIAKTSVAAAFINLISDIMMIKFIGIYAAVVSTILSYGFLLFYRIIDVRNKYFKVYIKKKTIVNFALSIVCISIIYYFNTKYTNIFNCLIATIFLVIFNFEEILIILNKMKELIKYGKIKRIN